MKYFKKRKLLKEKKDLLLNAERHIKSAESDILLYTSFISNLESGLDPECDILSKEEIDNDIKDYKYKLYKAKVELSKWTAVRDGLRETISKISNC